MQIEIGSDEKKQVDERKNQNVGENKYIIPSIEDGRNKIRVESYGASDKGQENMNHK